MYKNLGKTITAIFLLWGILSLQSCATSDIRHAASSAYLKNKVSVSRQGQFSISTKNHLGLLFDTSTVNVLSANTDDTLLNSRLQALSAGAESAFNRLFSRLTPLDSMNSANAYGIDFLVKATVLSMTLTEIKEPNSLLKKSASPEHSMSDDFEVHAQKQSPIPTDTLTIKLVLHDARSKRIIDIAYLEARSGQLDYRKGYQIFAEQSFRYYVDSIASWQSAN